MQSESVSLSTSEENKAYTSLPAKAAPDADRRFMREAIRLARRAAAKGDVPIGCVIVHNGTVIARGYNKRTAKGDVLCHAEILAIHKACRVLGDWRLEDCCLYVTLEPCPMCAGAIVQARIPRVVIGCMNPKAGCAGSILDLLQEPRFNHQAAIERDVLGTECAALMKDFFKQLRLMGKKKKAEQTLAQPEKIIVDRSNDQNG